MSLGFQNFLIGWFQKPQAKRLYEQESALLEKALDNLFGFYLVQFGRVGQENPCRSSRVNHKLLVDHELPARDASYLGMDLVSSDLDYLPIAKDCIDVIVLPHTLEVAADPHYLLRQVDAMLVPEGHLVISGFNPLGCAALSERLFAQKDFKQANLESAQKLSEWLRVLGYEIQLLEYTPIVCLSDRQIPFKGFWASVLKLLQKVFSLFGVQFGNSYCLVAKKRVDSPTLVGLKWRMPRWRSVSGKVSGKLASRREINHAGAKSRHSRSQVNSK